MIDASRDSTLVICDECGWTHQAVGWDHRSDAITRIEQHHEQEHGSTK